MAAPKAAALPFGDAPRKFVCPSVPPEKPSVLARAFGSLQPEPSALSNEPSALSNEPAHTNPGLIRCPRERPAKPICSLPGHLTRLEYTKDRGAAASHTGRNRTGLAHRAKQSPDGWLRVLKLLFFGLQLLSQLA